MGLSRSKKNNKNRTQNVWGKTAWKKEFGSTLKLFIMKEVVLM